MGTFYKIQLRRFDADSGYTGQARELSPAERRKRNLSRIDSNNLKQVGQDVRDDRKFVDADESIIFNVSPNVSESRSAEYVDKGLPGPVGIIVYATTSNRNFSIEAKLVSRNLKEAAESYYYANLLRSWMIPQSSESGESRTKGKPPILRLNGYKQQFYNIPVVLTEMSISYPEDVDYIELDYAMVPIVQNVKISLKESHNVSLVGGSTSVDDLRKQEFDLAKFKQGRLPGY